MKPIFIVSFGNIPSLDDKEKITNLPVFKKIEEDYHLIICFEDRNGDRGIQFKMFSDKEIEPIDLQSLKDIINNGTSI